MLHARPDYDRIQDPDGIIPADEPVFLLRGQDKLAWQAVLLYAQMLERNEGDPAFVKMCYDHVARMRDWPVKKLPDLPKTETT